MKRKPKRHYAKDRDARPACGIDSIPRKNRPWLVLTTSNWGDVTCVNCLRVKALRCLLDMVDSR